jgi:hypothetical protein
MDGAEVELIDCSPNHVHRVSGKDHLRESYRQEEGLVWRVRMIVSHGGLMIMRLYLLVN